MSWPSMHCKVTTHTQVPQQATQVQYLAGSQIAAEWMMIGETSPLFIHTFNLECASCTVSCLIRVRNNANIKVWRQFVGFQSRKTEDLLNLLRLVIMSQLLSPRPRALAVQSKCMQYYDNKVFLQIFFVANTGSQCSDF